jgi:hypothetical protein
MPSPDYTDVSNVVVAPAPPRTDNRIAHSLAAAESPVVMTDDSSGYTQVGGGARQVVQPAAPAALRPRHVDRAFATEKLDTKHRMGNYLTILMDAYAAKQPRPKLGFYAWVDAIGVGDFKRIISAKLTALANNNMAWWAERLRTFQMGVKYKDTDELRDKYLIKVSGGMLMRRGKIDQRGKWIDTGKLEPFNTTVLNSHWSGDGWAMWVESQNKDFYANRMKVLRFQHTSFLAGGDVLGAGEWVVTHGSLTKISGRSGHYQPTLNHLVQALRHLETAGVAAIDNVDVALYSRLGNQPRPVKWRDLKTIADPNRDYKVDPNA